MPNTWRTDIFMSGRADAVSLVASMKASCGRQWRPGRVAAPRGPRVVFLSLGSGPAQFRQCHNAFARSTVRPGRLGRNRSGPPASAEACRLERVVGPDDVPEPVLERAVAAMG